MMKKSIILLIPLLLLACNGPNKKEISSSSALEGNCIKQIFEKDSIYGNIRNHASEKIAVSEVINNYSKNLKSLDYSQCPEKFETAFHKHINAWLDFKIVSDKYPLLRGELHDIFDIIKTTKDSTAFKASLNQIMETWKMVEKSAKE